MKRLLLCWVILLSFQNPCNADPTKLSKQDKKALQEVPQFQAISAVTNLPSAIVQLCADSNGRLAEPGEKWDPTDLISDPKLPRHRLIWASANATYYVVHYESGGRAHIFRLLVARMKEGDKRPSSVWRGFGGELKDFTAFAEALANNELADDASEHGR